MLLDSISTRLHHVEKLINADILPDNYRQEREMLRTLMERLAMEAVLQSL
jgi:hypothetical protein